MKTAIIYYNFLDRRGIKQKIGGVETYLWNLARLILERGGKPILIQAAEIPFEMRVGAIPVIGVTSTGLLRKNIRKDLFKAAMSHINLGKDILIFGADHASVRTQHPKCISIQHGVSWDLPARFLRGGTMGKLPLPPMLQKRWIAFRAKRYFNNCPNRVCVDYNFLNWYRTQTVDEPEGNIWIIPNFVKIPADFAQTLPRPWHKPVRIIFARRFVEYRGSLLMESVSQRLLARHQNIHITFAGEGPDCRRFRKLFTDDSRVSIIKYKPDEALRIHSRHDIAIVPSLASEGTSFSLLEAMAAGCAVVASSVGGMTNIVIDGYNGRLVSPKVNDLTKALDALIADKELRLRLGQVAYDTARNAFGLERWKDAWTVVLTAVEQS